VVISSRGLDAQPIVNPAEGEDCTSEPDFSEVGAWRRGGCGPGIQAALLETV